MKLEKPINPNYAATVVALDKFVQLTGCDNVQGALIYGNQVIVGKDAHAGDVGLYFPVECALSAEFLSNNNLYRPSVANGVIGNKDREVKGGFFEVHGRVRTVKFHGHKSEGFWIPLSCLEYLYTPTILDELQVGDTFDRLGDHEICRKYVPRCNPASLQTKQGRKASIKDQIVYGQFHFHIDTEQLRRNIHKILPTDIIDISDKWHGTSAIYANIMVKRPLKWYERVLKRLGVNISTTQYSPVWSSRRVIKGVGDETKKKAVHFYSEDIWGVVGREVFDVIPRGFTVYGEIVGWTPSGEPIQPGYPYGCAKGTHKFLVYRVTFTTPEGKVFELSRRNMEEFCKTRGLHTVKDLDYGPAAEIVYYDFDEAAQLTDTGAHLQKWQGRFLAHLEKYYVRDQKCPHNDNEVPAEGIVVRVEKLDSFEAYKLKNFAFLKRETDMLDKGEVDMESQQENQQESEG